MYFTFSKELSYGLDSTSQDHVIDLVSEEIITNLNYEKPSEFNSAAYKTRYKTKKTSGGRIRFDLTYGNEGISVLLECLIGKRKTLPDKAFKRSYEHWNILTGMLKEDLDSSSTSFTVEEHTLGEFNGIEGIIVGEEYIKVTAISDGSVTVSERASEGTTAIPHKQCDLVYGVVNKNDFLIEIISRNKEGFCYTLPSSITGLIYRIGDYYKFNGIRFSDFILSISPAEEGIDASMELYSKNADIVSLGNPSRNVDNFPLIRFEDINLYSMNQWIDASKVSIQISNALSYSSNKFFDITASDILMTSFSTYGAFSLIREDSEAFKSYLKNEMKNLSVTICDSRPFNKAFVFSFNQVRYGTILHILKGSDRITDSVPFYSYGPQGFTLLIQR